MPRFTIRYACGALVALIVILVLTAVSYAHVGDDLRHILSGSSAISASAGLQWNKVELSSLPALARHQAVVVEEPRRTLCAIGGNSPSAYCYPLDDLGKPYEDGPEPSYNLPESLRFHAATSIGNRTYILGGRGSDDRNRNDVYCVEYRGGNDWNVKRVGAMKQPVMQHTALSIGTRIYVLGGFDGSNYLTNVWSVDVGNSCDAFDEKTWRPEASSLPIPLTGHAAAPIQLPDGKKFIYIIGGLTKRGNTDLPINTVFRAQVESGDVLGTWTDLGAADGMPPLWLLTAAASGPYLQILGGATTANCAASSAKVYRAWIDQDGNLHWENSLPDLPVPLHAHATVVSRFGFLYTVGGMNQNILKKDIYYTLLPLLDFKNTVAPQGFVTYDDTISYTLRLTNLGVRNLGRLIITDTLDTHNLAWPQFRVPTDTCQIYQNNVISCSIPSLALGETRDLAFQAVLTVPQTSPTWLAEQDTPSIATSPQAGPDLSVQKRGEQPLVVAGRSFNYTLVVYNSGPSPAQAVVMTDSLPAGVSYVSASLPPASTMPLKWTWDSIPARDSQEIRLTVRTDSGISGILTNLATVSSNKSDPIPSNNQAQAWTVVVHQADLSISKTDTPDPVMAGGTLTYTLVVHNAGPSNAEDVMITDTLPSGVTFYAADPPPTSGPPNPLKWYFDLRAGETRTIQIVTTVGTGSKGTICNEAGVSSNIEISLANNFIRNCTGIYTAADLVIDKTASPVPVTAGERLTYTLVVTNTGPSTATNVIVTDTLPSNVELLYTVPPTNVVSGAVAWRIPELPRNEKREFKLIVEVDSGSGGALINQAEVRSDVPDSKPDNNKIDHRTGINSITDLRLQKTHQPELIIAGDTLTYTLEVCNDGPSDALDVCITDWLPDGLELVGTSPEADNTGASFVMWHTPTIQAGQCANFRIVLKTDPAANGDLVNVALVTSTTPDKDPRNNRDQDRSPVNRLADLGLDQHSDSQTAIGKRELKYTLLVTNHGPSDAHNVIITDVLPAGLTWRSSAPPLNGTNPLKWQTDTLGAGDVWTITLVASVSPRAVGLLVNQACASSSTPDVYPPNNCASARVKAQVPVTNTARACEGGLWCQDSNLTYNPQFDIYLPVGIKTP